MMKRITAALLLRGVALAAGTAGLAATAQVAIAKPMVEKSVKAGAGLYQAVFNPTTGDVYVASAGKRGENNARVVILDGKTLAIEGAIDVSASPVFGLGLNNATQMLYGTSTREGAVTVIDLKAGKIVGTVLGPNGAKGHVREVRVDEARNLVYVSVVGGGDGGGPRPQGAPGRPAGPAGPGDPAAAQPGPGGPGAARPPHAGGREGVGQSAVWVIDGKTNTLSHVIENPSERVTGLALAPDGKRAYVTDLAKNEVAAIDVATRQAVAHWPTGGEGSINVATDATGARLFVANMKSGSLSVLDARTGQLITSVPTGAGALSVAYNPRADQIYVSNRGAGTVSVVDGKSYAVVETLQTGTLPQTIVIDGGANLIYVTNKARGAPRNAPPGTPPVEDPNGDTLSLIRP